MAVAGVGVDRAAGVVRKWAEVAGAGRLERVELERWTGLSIDGPQSTGEPVAYNTGPTGLGQPLFVRGARPVREKSADAPASLG